MLNSLLTFYLPANLLKTVKNLEHTYWYVYICTIKQTNMDTRAAILQKNFQAIYQHGFQATRTDKVISTLGITKGAFYHYFPDKASMGYAIIEEILQPMYISHWQEALQKTGNSIDQITNTLDKIAQMANTENVGLGCPLNNLMQEMSTIDEKFRLKLAYIIDTKIDLISQILQKGIDKKEIKNDIVPTNLASFIIASLEGSFSLGKVKNSLPAFQSSMQTLKDYLHSLKAT